jgi:hypothetical protein
VFFSTFPRFPRRQACLAKKKAAPLTTYHQHIHQNRSPFLSTFLRVESAMLLEKQQTLNGMAADACPNAI